MNPMPTTTTDSNEGRGGAIVSPDLEQMAKSRAQWLHDHKAPSNWVVFTIEEVRDHTNSVHATLQSLQEDNKRLREAANALITRMEAVESQATYDRCQVEIETLIALLAHLAPTQPGSDTEIKQGNMTDSKGRMPEDCQ